MALRLYRESLPPAMTAARKAADTLRAIRDAQGDLPLALLDEAQRALARSAACAGRALSDLPSPIDPTTPENVAADAYLASYGGPTTVADLAQAAARIDAAAKGWGRALQAALRAWCINAAALDVWPIDAAPVLVEGVEVRGLTRGGFLPASLADPLRQNPALMALISAYEAAGA